MSVQPNFSEEIFLIQFMMTFNRLIVKFFFTKFTKIKKNKTLIFKKYKFIG